MTFAAFIAAGALAWLHYAFLGPFVASGITVWTAWFATVLLVCGAETLRSGERKCILAWLVMLFSFIASHVTWQTSASPLLDLAIKNLIVASLIVLCALDATFVIVAGLHLVLILAAFLAYYGMIPGPRQRPRLFIAYSYPDIAAGVQHACLIILGGRAGGWIRRIHYDGRLVANFGSWALRRMRGYPRDKR